MQKASDITFMDLPKDTYGPKLAPALGSATEPEDCPLCGGLGVLREDVPIEHPNFGKLFPCNACGNQLQAARLRKLSRLTGDLAACRLEHWRPLPGVEMVMPQVVAYLVKRGKGDDRKATGWITLSGPAGTGKTHLLASMVNHYIEAGVPAIYATMGEILQQLRDSYDPKAQASYSQLWRDLTDNAMVVAIDELEKFSGTAWAQEQVFAFLNHRYNAMNETLTLMATNMECMGDNFVILPDTQWGTGYIESRMRDSRGIIINDFWRANDARPLADELEKQLALPTE